MIRERVDLFSLPTQDRLGYFPNLRVKKETVIIPNYPSSHIYASSYESKQLNPHSNKIRLIHQGVFLPNNFEDLKKTIQKAQSQVHLVLAGPNKDEVDKITELNKNSFSVLGKIPYKMLPAITNSCHIGLALYGNHNIMVRTVSTASNKIFEYISLGLPVIFTDRPDFRLLFSKYKWANFVNPNYTNLEEIISNISGEYQIQSESARNTYEKERNFDLIFDQFLSTNDTIKSTLEVLK